MKVISLLLLALLPLNAQSDVSKLLAEGMRGAVAGLAPVAEKDKTDVLAVTAELLAKHVTFRPDGTASAIFTIPGTRQQVEWKKLVVRSIWNQPVTEADRLNGISRRFLVALGCDAHRTWDATKNAWHEWYPIGNPVFPSAFNVEWKGGKWVAHETDQIKWFIPGPGLPTITRQPKGKPLDLPPGMTRGK